jgi:hypothetical protein
MFADHRPRPWSEDDDGDERPDRLCPACVGWRIAFAYGLAAVAVLGIAALAFAAAYPFLG